MVFDPQWSERLTASGGPTQPLHAASVRNGILGDITRAITTDVTLRGRYASVFTWGQQLVTTHPEFADTSMQTKKQALYTLEKVLALTTLRYQQHDDVEAGTSGLVGKNRLNASDLLESDPIDLSAFTLRDGATAVRLSNTNRYYLYLRSRDTELGLTGVGEALAAVLDSQIEPYRDQIVETLVTESVTQADLDQFADTLSLQSLYADAEAHADELDILMNAVLGYVSWDSDRETVTVDTVPDSIDVDVFPYLRYETSDRRFENEYRDTVASEIHRLQRAWTIFILQTIETYQTTADSQYRLDGTARDVFAEFRLIARGYWLQEFAAVVLRLQLWLFCEYLERALPQAVPYDRVFTDLSTETVEASTQAAFDIELAPGSSSADQARVARELALYGQTPVTTPTVQLPSSPEGTIADLGTLRDEVTTQLASGWDETTAAARTSTLVRALQSIVDPLDSVSPQDSVIETWQRTLGYSLTLLMMILKRYRDLTTSHPVVDAYLRQEHGDDRVSLPQLDTYFSGFDDQLPITDVGQRVISDLVIDVHERVVRDRLRNSSPNRFSFSYDAEQDALRYVSGTSPLGREYLRYGLMQQLLLDIGLVTTVDDDAQLTARGSDLLARARQGGTDE
ncbi:hypothetical protein [Halosimplex halobium]|uniref:hypothetical protein n=1 Tax=Halosimplex halobium TaxID=3396618 RepID=UPI003F54DC61